MPSILLIFGRNQVHSMRFTKIPLSKRCIVCHSKHVVKNVNVTIRVHKVSTGPTVLNLFLFARLLRLIYVIVAKEP